MWKERAEMRPVAAHLELSVLLLKVLIFVRVAVRKLVYLDTILLNLLPDLQRNADFREERLSLFAHRENK